MTASARRAWLVGAAVVAAYIALAVVSGHLSPFARRPLLDGVGPPPAYRWVDPPPALAAGNQEPLGKSFTIALSAGGSAAGVFSTPDVQATIVLTQGAIPAAPGQNEVSLSIKPLAPTGFGAPPKGFPITGNVYEVTGRYEPSGDPVGPLETPANVVLLYPASANPRGHVLLESTSGTTWTTVPSRDSPIQQQVTGTAGKLGPFSVAERRGAQQAGGGSSPLLWIGLAVAAAVAGAGGVYLFSAPGRARRRARREAQRRRERARRRAKKSRQQRRR